MAFVFNQVRQGTKISGKAFEAVAQHGRVIPVKVIARAVHQDSMGVSALDLKDRQARSEIMELWQWIREDLDGKARGTRRIGKTAASLDIPVASGATGNTSSAKPTHRKAKT